MCKALKKVKLKEDPSVIQSTNRQFRIKFMNNKGLIFQRRMLFAFTATKEEIYLAIKNPYIKSFTVEFHHPVLKLTFKFDRKNSEKLKRWLSSQSRQVRVPTETTQSASTPQPEPVIAN